MEEEAQVFLNGAFSCSKAFCIFSLFSNDFIWSSIESPGFVIMDLYKRGVVGLNAYLRRVSTSKVAAQSNVEAVIQ